MKQSNKVKVQVFCPEESALKVREAIGGAGGGRLGNYEYCSFVTRGAGYFRPNNKANPSSGEIGKINEVEEVKIEFLCDKRKVQQVVEAIKKAHPYEEVPIDILPILDIDSL